MSVSGKKLSMKVGVTTFAAIVGWTVREKVDELDAATAADAGYDHPDAGFAGATIEIKGVLDITTGVYSPIKAGTTITTLKLYRDINDTTEAYSFPTALVVESSQGAENRGRFEISATAKSSGTYTYNEPA